MSVSQELQNIRAGLEEESRSLDEERKSLEEKAKMLRDKAAIEMLRKSNAAVRGVISKLKIEIKELEQKLNETIETSAPSQQSQEAIAENVSTMNPEVTPAKQQSDYKEQEERKRRYF